MKNNRWVALLATAMLLGVCILDGCTRYHGPADVWNPASSGEPGPVVNSVVPAHTGWAGITPIVINGTNLSTEASVYFGKRVATVLSSTPSQIKILAPLDTGSNYTIKVVTPGSFTYASYTPYQLISNKEDVVTLSSSSAIDNVDIDGNGNIYVHQAPGNFIMIPPGQLPTVVGTNINLPTTSCMKVNTDGYIYYTCPRRVIVYRLELATGKTSNYVVHTFGTTEVFDFGKDGKTIYAGGKKNFYSIDASGNATQTSYYNSDTIRAIRVYGDYVYIGLRGGVWRNIINADGSLGQSELYFDWQNAGPANTH